MNDGTGLAEALLGLPGFRVLEVSETLDELVVVVETTTDWTGCASCGTRAVAHERMGFPRFPGQVGRCDHAAAAAGAERVS